MTVTAAGLFRAYNLRAPGTIVRSSYITLACLLLASTLAAQSPVAPRYRIVPPDLEDKFAAALNEAAADHYRLVLYAGAALMERTDDAEPAKFVIIDRITPNEVREALNVSGARGYRLLETRRRCFFPGSTLLMEKAPGRPNQFQYVLESGHHIAMGTLFPRDDFSRAPELIADRIRAGYFVAAQAHRFTILEKAAETAGAASTCSEARCFELKVLDPRKHFAESLSDRGRFGLRFVSAVSWQGMSTTQVLTLMVGDDPTRHYDYATIPARYDKLAEPLRTVSGDGYCVRARVGEVILFERSGGPRCEYRVLHGDEISVARDLEALAQDGFRPVLLSPEMHAGFWRGTFTYTVLAEREAKLP